MELDPKRLLVLHALAEAGGVAAAARWLAVSRRRILADADALGRTV
ncbi:hypothetical protein [Streptacidiphilus sp. MAP5-3]